MGWANTMIEESILQAKTLPEMFLARLRATPERLSHAQKRDGVWVETTYGELGKQVEHATLGFHALGLKSGDNVAIWGDTMAEWTVLDLGALTCGANVAGVYQTSTQEQVKFILTDASTKILCVDTKERLDKALQLRGDLPQVEKVISWADCEHPQDDWVMTMDQLLDKGKEIAANEADLYEKLATSHDADALAILIYTSGTTGTPKGVMLSHTNCLVQARGAVDNEFLREGDSMISFLPMSHVAEHAAQFMARVYAGLSTSFVPDMNQVGDALKERKPTLLVAVPRLYEKMRQKIMTTVESGSPTKQKLFGWALEIGDRVAKHKARKEAVPMALKVQHRLADKLVLSKVREAFGGRVRVMLSSAAPIDVETIEFFTALGVIFLEAYGLSECGGASHANTPTHNKIGTVGRAMGDCECRLAEDGEVLIRGSGVFMGYLNRPDATKECLDDDGWLHTGDIGEIDEEGFLKITDRKKNLIITAGGKNVAPAHAEMLVKREPVISQVVVVGDRKPYLTALVTLSQEVLDAEKLTKEQVHDRVQSAVDKANEELARYEQIKKYRILDSEFSIESGEMTPTMKIKRNVVMQNNEEVIAALYAE